MRATAIALSMAISMPAYAQVALPDEFASARKCAVEAAQRYAALDASISEVADAAIASCQPELDAFRPPRVEWTRPDDSLRALDRLEGRLRADALAAVAEARLAR